MRLQVVLILAVGLAAVALADKPETKKAPSAEVTAEQKKPAAPVIAPKKPAAPARVHRRPVARKRLPAHARQFRGQRQLRPKFHPKFLQHARQFNLKKQPAPAVFKKKPVGVYKKRKPAARLPNHIRPAQPHKAAAAAAAPQRKELVKKQKEETSGGIFGLIASLARRFANNRAQSTQSPSGPSPKHAPSLAKNRRRFFNAPPNAPKVFFMEAEDIAGYEKFTLDEVIHPEKDAAEGRSDDVKESVITYVDSPKKVEKVEKKEEEAEQEKKAQKDEKEKEESS